MRHSAITDWVPHLCESDPFITDPTGAIAAALLDAPLVTLAPGEWLHCSRSGEALALLQLSGTLRVYGSSIATSRGLGGLIGIMDLVVQSTRPQRVEAVTEVQAVLIDRHRLRVLSELSPLFASRAMNSARQSLCDRFDTPARAELQHSPVLNRQEDVPGTIGAVMAVKLHNFEAFEVANGPVAAQHARHLLGDVVDQSVRPYDSRYSASDHEALVCVHGDTLAASVMASRLVAKAERTVLYADMHLPLPHLRVVVGIALPRPFETMGSVIQRAREHAERALQPGEIVTDAFASARRHNAKEQV
jgi:hypothetical protein